MNDLSSRRTAVWNEAHSAELVVDRPKDKHRFTHGKGCAELNTDRFEDTDKVVTDNWVGGFYMEVYVDGWDVDKVITLDFHTADIEFPKHACQNVRVVGYTETTVSVVVVQQRWICCESFGCALRGNRPERISFSCSTLGSPPPSPPPLPMPPPPPSPPKPRPPPPPSPPPPPRRIDPPAPPPPPIMRVTEVGVIWPSGQSSDVDAYLGHPVAHPHSISTPPHPAVSAATMSSIYQGAGLLALAGFVYSCACSRGILPWAKGKAKGVELIPQIDAGAVRAKPQKVNVKVECSSQEETHLVVSTKGISTVSQLGELLAERMLMELDIEDAFKLYYVDNDGDTMLVSSHTGLRDLLYSEQITAKVDECTPEQPPPPVDQTKRSKISRPIFKEVTSGCSSKSKLSSRTAPRWDC